MRRSICPRLYMFAYKHSHLTISPFVVYAYFHIRGQASLPPTNGRGSCPTASILPLKRILAKQKSPAKRSSDASADADNLWNGKYRISPKHLPTSSVYSKGMRLTRNQQKKGWFFSFEPLGKSRFPRNGAAELLPFPFLTSSARLKPWDSFCLWHHVGTNP